MLTPKLLQKGDKVLVVAPSGKLPKHGLNEAVQQLEKWGLQVELDNNVFNTWSVFAGTDQERSNALNEAISNSEVKLILAARGGYGLTRYLDDINLSSLVKHPKWIVGFSDVTALHLAAYRAGIRTIHGPMGTSFSRNGAEESINYLHQLLFTGKPKPIRFNGNHINSGTVSGPLVGGNLSLVCDSLGTASEIDTRNTILVLEDIGDYVYRIDRMFTQLYRAGKFNGIKALVLGDFSDMLQGSTPFSESIIDIARRLCASHYFPVAVGAPIGHNPNNIPFVHGSNYKLTVSGLNAQLELTDNLSNKPAK